LKLNEFSLETSIATHTAIHFQVDVLNEAHYKFIE